MGFALQRDRSNILVSFFSWSLNSMSLTPLRLVASSSEPPDRPPGCDPLAGVPDADIPVRKVGPENGRRRQSAKPGASSRGRSRWT